MSGPIRQQLALAKARLKRYLDELTDHRPFLQDNLSADENVDRLTELKNNLVFERNRIDKTSQLIDQKNSEWAEYLRTLADNELKNEQALYDQTTETADSFLHFWDTAQEKLSTIDSWLFEIDSLLGPLLLQRTGAGPSGGISATTSASAAILNSTVAIPIPSATISASAAPAIPPQHPVQQLQQLRLPKLEIKPFYGNPVEWNEFYDAFTSSVHSQHIHDVQKFAYLKGFLRGQALQSIEGIPMNNANYNEALQILRNRFGDGDLIKQALYSQFRKLPTVQRLRADELRPFVDSMEKTCRQLSALGELLDHQSLAGVLMEKLPAAVIIKLEEQYKGANQGSWSLQQLREALGKLVAVQEKVNRISDVPQRQPIQQPSQSQQKGRAQSQRQFQPGYQPRSSADAFAVHKMERQPNRKFPMVRKDGQQSRPVVAAKPREPKSPCILCGGAHFNDSCSAFPSLESRKKKLRELNRCFICLRNGCHASYCRQVHRRCFHCQKIGEHSRMLCPNLLQKGVTNSTSSAAPMQRQKESTHVHLNKTATVGDSPSHLNPAQSISSSQSAPAEEVSVGKVENLNNAKRLAYLLTAEAYVINPSSKVGHVNVKVFLDSGSQKTFITNKLVEKLKLPIIERETLSIFTFGAQKPCVVDSSIVSFDMILQNGTCLKIEANALEKMTGNMKKGALSTEDLEYLKQIPVQYLAESLPYQQRSFEPDIMIGQDYFWDIMDTGEKQQLPSGMYLLPSKLGLLLGGRYKGAEEASGSHTYPAVVVQDPLIVSTARQKDSTTDTQDCLEKFWRLESIGIMDSPEMKEDDHAIENFNNTIEFRENRYHVTLPWKQPKPELPDNYGLALGRFKSLHNRLKSNHQLLEKYNAIIQDQLRQGIIEPVPEMRDPNAKLHYLPHHGVETPSRATTKLRIVFDASAKQGVKANSLNECLHRGPVILPDLAGVLLRFQLEPVGITADVEKAFLQICIKVSDRDVTRFFWYKDPTNPTTENNIKVFRFCRVVFGIVCSPFLLGATLKYHLQHQMSSVAEKTIDNVYVDNVLTGSETTQQATTIYHELKNVFRDASMNLREWQSNSEEFLESVLPEDKAKSEKYVKVLGLLWNVKDDTLQIASLTEKGTASESSSLPTKRQVLTCISNVFDPLGFLAPAVLQGKLFIQNLWKKGIEWDQPIPIELESEWNQLLRSLQQVDQFKLPRFVGLKASQSKTSLIAFVDASAKAYAVVVYLRMQDDRKTTTKLIFAKTRVAPKSITLPRLELMALVLGVRAIDFVKTQLKIAVQKIQVFSDSQCVLKWITTTKPLSTFVSNRLKEILSHQDIVFSYVPSGDNSADCASRGLSTEELKNFSLWWNGPKWLTEDDDKWPKWNLPEVTPDLLQAIKQEVKKVAFHQTQAMLASEKDENGQPALPVHRFSKLNKLVKTTCIVLRFLKMRIWDKLNSTSQQKYAPKVGDLFTSPLGKGHFTAQDYKLAKAMLLRQEQQRHCADIFANLTKDKRSKMGDQLGIYLDSDGILRCSGRLANANLPHDTKFPKLLPRQSDLTKLIIEDVHQRNQHCGVQQTLATIRNEFWIPKGRLVARSQLRKCVTCSKVTGAPYKLPPMPQLPVERITKSRPFQYVGLDYFGPVFIKNGSEKSKVWVSLFTCLATRAVHLEVARDMSTEKFLNCLRRFVARRGQPSKLISDNAAQFKLAKTTLDQAWSQIFQSEDVVNYCAKEGMEWHFIPEFAPWQGGAYERMVGLCKSGLKKAIGHKLLEMDQFETLLCEAEAVVNSRPLTYNTSDISSPIILRPIDFLISHGQVGTPQLEDDANDPEYVPKLDSAGKLLKYFRSSQKCLDFFWNFWSSEYLQSLRERYGTQHPYPRGAHNFLPQEGTVVLMKEEHMPRATWKIGRISKLIHGHDDHIRSVEVALPNKKTLTRPINLLYPIELQEKQETTAAASNYASVSSNFKLLNSHAMLMMVILLLASFLVPTMANKCPEPDEKIKGLKSIWSSSCIASGYVVMRDGNNHLCWRKVACANGHLNNKGTCSHTCKCPEWATHCSHGVDKWPKIAHTEKTPLVLELARPNICAFQPSNNCNSEPVHIRLPQIELLNGTKVFIKALNIKWIQHVGEDFECIGSGRLSGTTEFCQKHECVQEATKFCKYAETELAFFFNAEGEIPIRAYGEIPLKVYMEKTTEKHIECPTCELKCIRGGVEAKLTAELGLLEICSPPICYKQSFPKPIESVLFPAEINLVEHQISVKIWSKGMLVKEMMTTCPPTPFCEMIDCYICWARIANPQCSSKYWLILAAVMVYFFSLTMYIGLKIVQLLGKFILHLLRALVLCGKVCFKCCRKAKTKTYETVVLPVFTLLEDENVNETEGDPLPTASQPLLKQTPAKLRLGNKPYRLKLPYLATTIVALSLIPMANCCSEVTSLTAHYTGCTVSQNGTAECVFNEVTRIALSPQGQESCLLLKDPMGEPLGTLSVEVKKIVLKCQSKTEYYTRSYEMKTRASKRCPNAGSCSSPSKCGDVKLTSKLEELKGEANDNPGFTYCAEACGSPFCGCFWWTYACLFYRTYASPLTDPVYEAFSCPFWKYCLSANVKFTTEGNTKNHRFNLLPGIVSEWKNMRFTLISITDPPIPLLSKSFLTNGKVTILTDVSASGQPVAGTVGSLQCRSWEKAQNFDCDIPHSLCNCQPMDPRVSCTCTNGNLGELFKHQEKIIPLSTEGVHLSGGGKEIEAELTHYTAMEFQISMKNFRLSTKIEKNFCTITPAEFGGCYNCITGAKLKYLCTTDFGDATAHVVCGKATFSTACKSKGLLRTTNIVFSTPVVEEECTVRCPAGTTSFKLSGQLVFVERGLLFNASNIVTGNHSIDSPFDFGIDVLKGITSWFSGVWQTVLFFGIVFLLAVLLIPIAPYLLHLAFRILRLGIQHFARNVAKLLRHNQQSRKKAWKNSAKQW